MLNFSIRRSSWWQGAAVVSSGLAACMVPSPSALAQLHTSDTGYSKTQLPSGEYSVRIWGWVIMDGAPRTRNLVFLGDRVHGVFGCKRSFSFEDPGTYRAEWWETRGTLQPTCQVWFNRKITYDSDPGDWFVFEVWERSTAPTVKAGLSGSSSSPLLGGRLYTWNVENDRNLVAEGLNARLTSARIGSHAVSFWPGIERGAGEEVSVEIPIEPETVTCDESGASDITIPCVAKYSDGSFALTWAHGPSADNELQCGTYAMQINPPDAVFQPGVTDIGNHGDDVVTTGVALPFGVRVGRTTYYSARASSNGNLQFTTTATAFANQLLPAPAVGGAMICAICDDLRTDGPGQGIFTSTSGASPSRRFNVEWRHGFYSGPTGTGICAISFYEDRNFFDVFYEVSPSNGQGATIGVQDGSGLGASATLYSHNPSAPGTLTGVRAIRYVCVPPTNPACSLVLTNARGAAGTSFEAYAVVAPGVQPTSNGITVMLDANSVNAGVVPLRDDGITPDRFSSDGVYSGLAIVGVGATLGAHTLSSFVQDDLLRGSVCGADFTVVLPPPINNECDGAVALLPGSTPFDNAWATTSVLAGGCATIGKDTWWSFQAPTGGNWVFDTCGAVGDTVLEVYDDCNGATLGCDDDACGAGGGSRVSLCMSAGQSVLIRLGGYNATATSGTLHATPGIGTCPTICHGACVSDFDDGSGTGTPDSGVTIDDLIYYLAIFEAGQSCADVDDGSGTGTPDSGVTIDDLLYYLVRFESGC